MTSPLAGASVVVTRPATTGGGDDLGDALRSAGARVVALPVVEVADAADGGAALEEAARHLARYRWVAFTSANAVRRLLALVPDAGALTGAGLAAVGRATAAALAEHGLVADLVAGRASAAGLAEAFPVATVPGERVLFPASAGARPTLPAALRAKGWAVDVVVAYRTVPTPAPSAGSVRELATAAAVTFASPSAVESFLSLRARDGRPLPVPPVVACIGPVTADAARSAGLEVAVVAPDASARALVDALVDALGGAPGGAPGSAAGGAAASGAPSARGAGVEPR